LFREENTLKIKNFLKTHLFYSKAVLLYFIGKKICRLNFNKMATKFLKANFGIFFFSKVVCFFVFWKIKSFKLAIK
jgi:hypothetical protein